MSPLIVHVKIDQATADKLLAIRKKIFLSKTAAIKMAVHCLWFTEVEGHTPERIATEAIQETKEALQQIVEDLQPAAVASVKAPVDLNDLLDSVSAQ